METTIFTPRKVAELMLLLKMARTINSPTEDSYVDAIGYAAIAGELAGLEYLAAQKEEEGYAALAAEYQEGPTVVSPPEWRKANGFSEDGK